MQVARIKSVKKIGIQDSLDFEVAHPDHNFYCEGLVTSNSHSFAYATLAAKTVYLKYKHPQEFFLSVLEAAEFEPDPLATISTVHQELSDFGIKLLPPDLLKSGINFQIEDKNIRYGLNSIKGVSAKSLEGLVEFRGSYFENKYECFLAAKECGLNISVVSALIQAGAMDSSSSDRPRLVLEAQAFNLLTEREKRNYAKLGERYNYDLLSSISDAVEKQTMGDDNRPIMKTSRFETFKNKFAQYRSIYFENKKHDKLTRWWYENSLLGYSYSYSLKDCFIDQYNLLLDSKEVSELPERERFKMVCQVKDVVNRTSRNMNKYMMIVGQDSVGQHMFLLMDNSRSNKLTEFQNHYTLSKEDLIVVNATRSDGSTSFIDTIKIIDSVVLMKLNDLKKYEKR